MVNINKDFKKIQLNNNVNKISLAGSNVHNVPPDENKEFLEKRTPLISGELHPFTCYTLYHVIYNLAQRNYFIKESNKYIQSIIPDYEERIKILDDENLNETFYKVITNSLYKNLYSSAVKEDISTIVYFPLHNSDYLILKNENPTLVLDKEMEELFVSHYHFYENRLMDFLVHHYDFGEPMVNVNEQTKRSLTSSEIKNIKNELSSLDLNKDVNKFLPIHIYNPDLFDLKNYTDDELLILFSISYTTMNSYLLNQLLSFDSHKIYFILQQAHPQLFFAYADIQELCMLFYTYYNNVSRDTLVYQKDKIFDSKDFILDFYKKIALYPQFIQIMEKQFNSVFVEDRTVQPIDKFKQYLTLNEINLS